MRIESELKLDFDDVLIKPKRSKLKSRKDVNLMKKYTFLHSKKEWEGVPVMASNMDTVGVFEMATVLQKHNMMTVMNKFCTVEQWVEQKDLNHNLTIPSIGTSDKELERFTEVYKVLTDKPQFLCIDVANGYGEYLIEFVKKVRLMFPDITLISGNVVSAEMTEALILSGVDVVKVGIGGGCFGKNTKVLMANGIYKKISEITPGEYVIDKEGKSVEVITVMSRGIKKTMKIKTNNWYEETYVTPDHQYWIGDGSSCSRNTLSSAGITKVLDKVSKTIPKKSKYKWKSVEELDTDMMFTLYPNECQWNSPDEFKIDLLDYSCPKKTKVRDDYIGTNGSANGVKWTKRIINSGYDLGYLFGLFMGDGTSHCTETKKSKKGSVHFYLGEHETNIINKIEQCIDNLFGLSVTKTKRDTKMTIVNLYNKPIAEMLYKFGKQPNKHLPDEYYCKDKNYVQGLYDGLMDSDGHYEVYNGKVFRHSLSNTSKPLIELFAWCCMFLKKSFGITKSDSTNLLLRGLNQCIFNDSYAIRTHSTNRFTKDYVYGTMSSIEEGPEMEVWDIEVDDESHSFIANNCAVHNSACTTRLKTGCGSPQFSAVIECADAAHGLGGLVISDGGCKTPGDVAKAFAAGADFVMLGGMLAGHDESAGELIVKRYLTNELDEKNEQIVVEKKFKEFYGMSSGTAQQKYDGEQKSYRASEGRTLKVPYKGPVENTLQEILGGLRSTCTYVGASCLKHLPKCATFNRVNNTHNRVFERFEN